MTSISSSLSGSLVALRLQLEVSISSLSFHPESESSSSTAQVPSIMLNAHPLSLLSLSESSANSSSVGSYEGSKVLYNFDRFVGHRSQRVPDVPKYGRCHGSWRGPDKRSNIVTHCQI